MSPAPVALWLVVGAILLSATFILALTLGPLRTAGNVWVLRAVAGVQFLAAAGLAAARLLGQA